MVALMKITVSTTCESLEIDLKSHPKIGILDKKGTPESELEVLSFISPPMTKILPLLILAMVSIVLV